MAASREARAAPAGGQRRVRRQGEAQQIGSH